MAALMALLFKLLLLVFFVRGAIFFLGKDGGKIKNDSEEKRFKDSSKSIEDAEYEDI